MKLCLPSARVAKRVSLTVVALLLGVVMLPQKAKAILGIGDIVYDPAALAELVLQYERQALQYTEQVNTTVNTLHTVENTLNHYLLAMQQAQYFASKARWLALSKAMWQETAQNVVGETVVWNTAINGSLDAAPQAWLDATIGLGDPSWIDGQPINASSNLADFASVEIADSMGVNSLRTLADLRTSQSQSESALQSLELDALDTSDNTNVQVKQLNLTAAGTVQLIHSEDNILNALGYSLQQQIISNKPMRDGIAASMRRNSAMYLYQQSEPTGFSSPTFTLGSYVAP
jgi:hypothetical protein